MKLKADRDPAPSGAAARGESISQPPWSEVLDEQGIPRPHYGPLLQRLDKLPRSELRLLDQRIEATMRELGVTFDLAKTRTYGQKPWSCDLLPHIFDGNEWTLIVRGMRQRMKAFEAFLSDIYGQQEILRHEVIPIPPILGSPHFQRPAVRLKPHNGRHLYLGGVCLKRDAGGAVQVSSNHFGHPTGISYMVQNRRVLARVAPDTFSGLSVAPIAETPTAILEALREAADMSAGEPLIVMLSPGPGSPFYSEHGFLARRMGMPLVQGGDLVVLDDHVYLKTIGGLERVHVIYNRVSDHMLDRWCSSAVRCLVCRGWCIACANKPSPLANALGSQLADDRALLPFASRIIRFYLGEAPLLSTMPTYWCGDPDQREYVLDTSRISASSRASVTVFLATNAGCCQTRRRKPRCATRSGARRISSSRNLLPKAPKLCASRAARWWNAGRINSSLPCTKVTISTCFPAL